MQVTFKRRSNPSRPGGPVGWYKKIKVDDEKDYIYLCPDGVKYVFPELLEAETAKFKLSGSPKKKPCWRKIVISCDEYSNPKEDDWDYVAINSSGQVLGDGTLHCHVAELLAQKGLKNTFWVKLQGYA